MNRDNIKTVTKSIFYLLLIFSLPIINPQLNSLELTNEEQKVFTSESSVYHSVLAEIGDQSISIPQSFLFNDSEEVGLDQATSTYNGIEVSKTVSDEGSTNLPFNYTIPSFENSDSEKRIDLNIETVYQDAMINGDAEANDSLLFWTEEGVETPGDFEGFSQEIIDDNVVFNVNLTEQSGFPWEVGYLNSQELETNTIISFDFFPSQLDIDPLFYAIISFRFFFLE